MGKEEVIIDYKNGEGQILCSPHIFKLLREKFSVLNKNYMARKRFPRIYIITPSGMFPIGLYTDIKDALYSFGIPLEVKMTYEFLQHFKPKFDIYDIEKIDGFQYYDYQEATINEFIKNGRGISLLPTASGKGLVMGGLIKTMLKTYPNFKILIIVPNITLLHQLQNNFTEFGLESTIWGDSELPDWSKNILIANSQILYSDIKYTLSKLQNYDIVIVDEVHTLGEKGNIINKVIKNIKTDFKFGVTGTLPDNLLACWNIIGRIGPIVYEKTSYDIRKQGTISDLIVKIIKCKHSEEPLPPTISGPLAEYDAECDFLYNNIKRNNMIARMSEKLDKNTLIVVDRLIHGQLLYDAIDKSNKQVFFVQGSTDTEERIYIANLMKDYDNVVCIAMSRIFSTGLSINNLHNVIFTFIGKSNIKIMQSMGRSLRLHESKNIATIFDISDDTKYSENHLVERIQLYKKEKIDFVIKNVNL